MLKLKKTNKKKCALILFSKNKKGELYMIYKYLFYSSESVNPVIAGKKKTVLLSISSKNKACLFNDVVATSLQ